MRDQDRLDALDTIAEDATLLSNLAATILEDIHAAVGSAGQERPQRVRLADDIRDVDPSTLDRPATVEDSGPRIADPTGEAAIVADPAAIDLAEIDKRLRRAQTDVAVIVKIFARHQTARTPAQIRNLRRAAAAELDDVGDDWCKSHLQIHVLEPIEVRKAGENAGRPYYVGMCRWCGSTLAQLKREHPKRFRSYRFMPIELLAAAHSRKRREIRKTDVEALLGPQHTQPPQSTRRPVGEDRQRRGA